MTTGVTVSEAMTTNPVMTRGETTIRDVARLMREYDVGSVLLEEDDELVGIVTENDFTEKVVAEGLDYDTPVEEIAETALVTVSPQNDITAALQTMKNNGIRHLPVMDDGDFVGYITLKDVLKIAPALFEVLVSNIDLREEGRKPIGERREE